MKITGALHDWIEKHPGTWLLTKFALSCSALGAVIACAYFAVLFGAKAFDRATATLAEFHPSLVYALWALVISALLLKLLNAPGHRLWPLQWSLAATASALIACGLWPAGSGWFIAWTLTCLAGLVHSFKRHRAAA